MKNRQKKKNDPAGDTKGFPDPADTSCIDVILASESGGFCESFLRYLDGEKDPAVRIAAVHTANPAAAYFRFLKDGTGIKPLSADTIISDVLHLRSAILLLDIDLPGIDSLSVIQELHRYGSSERVIVISEFLSSLHKAAFSVTPIGYYMRLPAVPSVLCKRIRECRQGNFLQGLPAQDPPEGRLCAGSFYAAESGPLDTGCEEEALLLKNRTTRLLHEIGIPANLCGHEYLREAIVMLAGDCEVYGKMTKIIYPAIAKKYAKSCSSVEKAIRTALDIAWMRGKTELLDTIFGFTVNVQKGKPTNSEFIALMADYLCTEVPLRESVIS